MGYTHYMTQLRDFTPEEWAKIQLAASIAVASAIAEGIEIAGWDRKGFPEVNSSEISLNGLGDRGCETFRIDRIKPAKREWDDSPGDEYFNFCKTRERPYDRVVVTILHWIKKVAPDAMRIGSDGGPEAIRDTFGLQLPV
jgi:hypothetical protein